jgi:hypothetical protein
MPTAAAVSAACRSGQCGEVNPQERTDLLIDRRYISVRCLLRFRVIHDDAIGLRLALQRPDTIEVGLRYGATRLAPAQIGLSLREAFQEVMSCNQAAALSD